MSHLNPVSIQEPPQHHIQFQARHLFICLYIYCHFTCLIIIWSLYIQYIPLIYASLCFCLSLPVLTASCAHHLWVWLPCSVWTDWLIDHCFLFSLFADLDLNKRLTLTSYCFRFITKSRMLYYYIQETESQRQHWPRNEVLGPRQVSISRE